MGKTVREIVKIKYDIEYAQDLLFRLEDSKQYADIYGTMFIGLVLGANKRFYEEVIDALKQGIDLIMARKNA